MLGDPAVDVVHDQCRRPEVSNNILEEQLDGRWIARIACVSAHAMRFFKIQQDRFIRIPCCDGDTHPVFREQSGAT